MRNTDGSVSRITHKFKKWYFPTYLVVKERDRNICFRRELQKNTRKCLQKHTKVSLRVRHFLHLSDAM